MKDEGETRSLIERCQEEYLIVLNHSAWSLLNFEDIASVEGLSGIEVSNYSTEALNGVEGSVHLWESGLRQGKRWLAFGGDDNHNGFPSAAFWPFGNAERDSFGSWIMANAADRSQPALMEALSLGNFYTTEGPEIHSFAVIDGSVHVRCSPVNRIIIKGERRNFVRRLGEGMTELVAPLNGESMSDSSAPMGRENCLQQSHLAGIMSYKATILEYTEAGATLKEKEQCQ